MAKVIDETGARSQPRWAADYLSTERLIPAGAALDATTLVAGTNGRKNAQAGTLWGRTDADRTARAKFVPVTTGNAAGMAETYLLAFDVLDIVNKNNEATFVRPNTTIREAYLPIAYTGAARTALSSKYILQTGAQGGVA
jgi:hypothetical protein